MRVCFSWRSHIRNLGIKNYRVVVCEYLLKGRFLVLNVDGVDGHTGDNDSVCRHAGVLCTLPLELCRFSGGTCKHLYVTALELVCCDDFDCTRCRRLPHMLF